MSKGRVLAALAVLAGSLGFATRSSAEPPTQYSFTVDLFFTFDCGGGVVLTEPVTYSESGRDFFRNGELIRTLAQAFFDGVITNEATGEQYRDSNHFNIEVDYVAHTFTDRGVIFNLHPLDGGPVLLLDIGTITADFSGDVIRRSAKHPATTPNLFGDYTELLCEAVGA